MEHFYLELLLVIGVLTVVVPFVLYFVNLFAGAVPIPHTSPFYNSINTISTTVNNGLDYVLIIVVLLGMMLGIVVDIYCALRWPNVWTGFANIIAIFIMVVVWLVLNNFIASSNILSAFGSYGTPFYQLFASSYLITALCAACMISASLHLSHREERK